MFNPWITLLGQTAYALVVYFVYHLYEPVTPSAKMAIWSSIVVCVFGAVLAFDITFVIRKPDDEEIFRFWRKVDKRIPAAFDLIAVAIIFLLFPYGSESLKTLTVAFFVGYVPLQMISDPENVFGNRFSIIVVLGTFAITILMDGNIIDRYLAMMMIIYGAVLFVASDALRAVVLAAVTAKFQSEQNAQALAAALLSVSASRDAKTHFIAAASHDLAQPLHAASLFFDQAISETRKQHRERAISGVHACFNATNQLLTQMLNYLRLEADSVVPVVSKISVKTTLRKLKRQYSTIAKTAGFEIRIVQSSLQIPSDVSLLERALGNLINNAITHSGGSKILVGCRKITDNRIRFIVADNGNGVPTSEAEHIFDDYFRGQNSVLESKSGFGLGLPSVRRISKLLGGEAGTISAFRKGALFYIDLPVEWRSQ